MTFTSRQAVFVLAVAVVLSGRSTLVAAPQSARGLEKGKGHQRGQIDTASPNYQQGFRDGQGDRANNRPHVYRQRADPRNNDPVQNRNYEAGYDAGFGPNTGQAGRRDDPRVRGYGQYEPNYQQGLRDGQADRANNRPHVYRQRADPRNNDPAQNRAYEAGYDAGFQAPVDLRLRETRPGSQYGQYEPNYQQGLRDGLNDRANDWPHQYRERADPRNNDPNQNRAYEAGYDVGFGVNADQYRRRDGVRGYGPYEPNYLLGLRDGQDDRANNRPHVYRQRADSRNNDPAQNRAYEAGYDAGFGPNTGRNDRRDDRERGQYGISVAARNGYQDGRFDGERDRRTGQSNRPTEGAWYRSATRGYDVSLGSRVQYREDYRQAYVRGYERGYNGR